MLVLSRKTTQKIVIANEIVLEVLHVNGKRVTLGLTAPEGVKIFRKELWDKMHPSEEMPPSDELTLTDPTPAE